MPRSTGSSTMTTCAPVFRSRAAVSWADLRLSVTRVTSGNSESCTGLLRGNTPSKFLGSFGKRTRIMDHLERVVSVSSEDRVTGSG